MKPFALFFFTAAATAAADHELSAAASAFTLPSAQVQQAVLTGATNQLTASWIPVTTGNGSTIYANLTFQLNVDTSGNISVASVRQTTSPATLTYGFRPGRYVAPGTRFNGRGWINVSGPGVTLGGATVWTLTTTSDAYSNMNPSSATWYTGPIENNPLAARLKKAGITSPFYSYGTTGADVYSGWVTNALIGVSQSGNSITFLCFTDRYGVDSATPVDQITYTLVP